MYLAKASFSQSAIDLLRSLVGLSTLREPQSLKSKIIFILLIFILMIFNSDLKGELYSAITIPSYHYFVSSKVDLLFSHEL